MGRPPAAALQARIDEHVVRELGELNALDVAQVLSAYSTMGHAPSDTLFDARLRELASRAGINGRPHVNAKS
jgi:hypothetical protein